MKKIIHKNQVVITTLAVLIAIAGYVSYDRKSGGAEETKTVANMKEDALSDCVSSFLPQAQVVTSITAHKARAKALFILLIDNILFFR